MIDVRRRSFLFGAAAVLALPAAKTFILLPRIRLLTPLIVSLRPDKGPWIAQVYQVAEMRGEVWDACGLYPSIEAAEKYGPGDMRENINKLRLA